MNFLRLIRFPNLIIVALTQYLLQYLVIVDGLNSIHLKPLLPSFQFFLLSLSTVLIAAGGYIINDIEDIEIDKINKPIHKQIVGRIYPLSMAWYMYILSIAIGFLISLYLAFYIHDFIQLLIYPAAVLLLWAYSKWFKRMALVGNLVVSFFCAFVAWVVFYAQSLYQPSVEDTKTGYFFFTISSIFIFVIYAVFAFISTLFREIIKDIEDAEGDKLENCHTLPILIGTEKSKWLAFVVGLLFLAFTIYISFEANLTNYQIILLNLSISLPLIYALFLLLKAKEKQDFSYLSKLAKFIMLSGLVSILILKT